MAATTADVLRLRRLANMPDDAQSPYTNPQLLVIIDGEGTVEKAAALLWREKAATYADLVDTTEGSSSRKLSQLRASALAMAEVYDPATSVPEVTLENRPRTRAIVRP